MRDPGRILKWKHSPVPAEHRGPGDSTGPEAFMEVPL